LVRLGVHRQQRQCQCRDAGTHAPIDVEGHATIVAHLAGLCLYLIDPPVTNGVMDRTHGSR
jgi:hypothetical protein